MNPSSPSISIVSPMHNEKELAQSFVERVIASMRAYGDSFELIVVDDGSSDETPRILESQTELFAELKVVRLARNSGQWSATYAGMQESKGAYVVVMDSDLQHLPEEIPLFIDQMKKGYHMVSGCRQKRKESWLFRRIPSAIANLMLRRITQCPVHDMGGFKCIEGTIARQLHLRAGQHRLLPALVWLQGGQVTEVPISAPPRTAGKSHYGLSRSFDVLFDIVLFWLQHSFKARPMYLFGHVSLWLFVASFCLFAWVGIEKVFWMIPMANRPPFFLAIMGFMLAAIFITFGFVLETLTQIQNRASNQRPYVIQGVIQRDVSKQTSV